MTLHGADGKITNIESKDIVFTTFLRRVVVTKSIISKYVHFESNN